MPGKLDSFKALSAQDKRHAVVNWLLDHAMIIIILLLAVYVQIQRPQFFGVPSLVNIISLTAARLPMALGVAGCIILAGTDLTGGRVAGLTAFVAAILLQKAGANGRFIADGVPQNLLLVVLLVMVIGVSLIFDGISDLVIIVALGRADRRFRLKEESRTEEQPPEQDDVHE